MDKQLIALYGTIFAGLISLFVAYLNLRASSRLIKLSRQYDLLKRDLDALDKLKDELNSIDTIPSLPDAETIRRMPKEELKNFLQEKLDKIQPAYKTTSGLMLREKALFPLQTQQELVAKVNDVESATGGAMLATRLEFIIWSQNTIDRQIFDVRGRWLKSA